MPAAKASTANSSILSVSLVGNQYGDGTFPHKYKQRDRHAYVCIHISISDTRSTKFPVSWGIYLPKQKICFSRQSLSFLTCHYFFWHTHMKHIALLCIIILPAVILTLGQYTWEYLGFPPTRSGNIYVYTKNWHLHYITCLPRTTKKQETSSHSFMNILQNASLVCYIFTILKYQVSSIIKTGTSGQ